MGRVPSVQSGWSVGRTSYPTAAVSGPMAVGELVGGAALVGARVDDRGARHLVHPVGGVAVRPLEDDLVLHAGRVRDAALLLDVVARHASRDAEHDGGGASGGGQGGLDAEQLRDVLAGAGLELPRVHEQEPGGIDGLLHGGVVTAADEGAVALRVDEGTHSEFLVYRSVAP